MNATLFPSRPAPSSRCVGRFRWITKTRAAFRSGLALTFGVILQITAFAQVDTGTIQGTVRDATGAVLPGAVVNSDQRRNGRLIPNHNERCRETISSLRFASAHTRSSPKLPGFAPITREGISLSIQQRYVADFVMKPSNLAETVERHCRSGTASNAGGLSRRDDPVTGHQRSSAERSQLRVPRSTLGRRRSIRSGRSWIRLDGKLLGQRPGQLCEQLSSGRRRQQLQRCGLHERFHVCVPSIG